ncbi:hypothetical protein [Tritonibacter mobilis]|uniref:hypothetical protein n=1 Tax=Tritonibacter mobilis TaxID=379347 RepID=UPI0019550A8F|nr:hypothetical protein [Tritonibacter mobilis]
MKDFQNIKKSIEALPIGTPIPKPRSADSSRLSRWGIRRSEPALIYSMPNHKNPSKPHEKGVTFNEFQHAFDRLMDAGSFSREWFNANMPACRKEGSCNFTTIVGIFQIIGIANYDSAGMYYFSK